MKSANGSVGRRLLDHVLESLDDSHVSIGHCELRHKDRFDGFRLVQLRLIIGIVSPNG